MLATIADLTRPFGVAFGVFILVNLALAIEDPSLSVTHIWLDVGLAEPGLSLFAGILGVALIAPHSVGESATARWLLGGIFCGFAILLGIVVAGFYQHLYQARLSTDFPVPLSLFLLAILVGECLRMNRWRAAESSLPPPARFFFQAISVAGAFVVIHLVYIVSYGHTDFRRPADAAVVFGAKVDAEGCPCAALVDRLDTAIEVYQQGLVKYLIMTGAQDPNGQDEPTVMARYAIEHGVPARGIILDQNGLNTRASAVNCRAIARQRSFKRLLAVTQYFHCARVKLAFDREATPCDTVPTCSSRNAKAEPEVKLSRESFFLLREAMAFPFYWLYYR
jgi:vancomycin permeability regulator SanA